ncbi:diguanylate cyclase [Sphaerotilus hippei]|uniref:diguanylate cyclase n=1 Tax=Sphaerotilus hippei TaxID=744406 RepID=A0A318GW11_9BURK|nr:diguanylate cyclase [Sphaerotilus hippei]PXW93676.1 diguanylate cyclase [Sphaerotilus hippei]
MFFSVRRRRLDPLMWRGLRHGRHLARGLLRRTLVLAGVLVPLLWLVLCLPVEAGSTPTPRLRLMIDDRAAVTLDQALSRLREDRWWHPVASDRITWGYTSAAYWFLIDLPPAGPAPGAAERLLEVAYPVLDHVDMVLLDEQGRVLRRQITGDALPFVQRAVAHRHFLLPIDQPAARQVLVRVQTTSSMQFPSRLWQRSEFEDHSQADLLVQGLYFGVMLGMLAYNLFLFFGLGERVYLWYVLWVACMTAFLGSLNGLSFQYLWPEAVGWNDTAIVFFLALAMAFAGRFMMVFMDLGQRRGWMLRVMQVFQVLTFLSAALAFVLPYLQAIVLLISLAMLNIAVAMVVSTARSREGFAPARVFMIAWGLVFLGGMLLALNKFGLLPRNLVTESGSQIGSAVEVVLLSLGLAARLNNERRLREAAQAEVIVTQREANERLEARVAERTSELEGLNRRLDEVSRTDGLTGVYNRRHFDECLQAEIRRSMRSQRPFALVLLDLDHFKRLNDEHGHQAGDECLRITARRARGVALRQSDVVARYGGEEFVILLPCTELDGAMQVARQLCQALAAHPVAFEGLQLPITASLGVCGRIPVDLQDGLQMLSDADAALYRAKRAGRNRVEAAF